MIFDRLKIANNLLLLERYKEANLIFEKVFPPDVFKLRDIFQSRPSMEFFYKNYLYSLLKVNEINPVSKFVHEFFACNPENRSFIYIDDFRRELIKTNHSGPLLSIIVPVYNSGKYLDNCIQSIRDQTYKDFELIIVNDGSTDDSLEIINKHKEHDHRIVVIDNKTPSGNPGKPRNQALDVASGLYIGFVDSDDWINTDFFERLISKALSENSDIVFSGGFYNHEPNGHVGLRSYDSSGFVDPSSGRFKIHDSFMIWDKIFHKSLIDLFYIRLGETKAAVDVPFIFSAYYYATKIGFVDELIGYNYRRESESSVTVAHRKNSNCDFEFLAFDNVRKWAEINCVPGYYLKAIDIKLVSSLMYTLKMVSEEHFDYVFQKVKTQFSSVDTEAYKAFCVQNKKWWQFKEFENVISGSSGDVKEFLEQKKKAAEKKRIEKILTPKFQLDGAMPGILFFPCWTTNNPYQQLLYNSIHKRFDVSIEGFDINAFGKEIIDRKKGKFKYIHLHWLHNFFSFDDESVLSNTLNILDYAKSNGFEIIYTAHNVCSHDSQNEKKERLYREQILRRVDYTLVHGEFAKKRLISEFSFPSGNITVVPHGTYGDFYGEPKDKAIARNALELPHDATVLLFFGNIKGYKGLFNLLECFKNLRKNYDNLYLLVAGRVLDSSLLPVLYKETEDPNILFRPGFVQNQDVINYFCSADLCVLPYEKVLTSGAAMLSLTLQCPILAPSIGILPEVVDTNVGLLFDSYDDMESKIESFHLEKNNYLNSVSFDEFLANFAWSNVVESIEFLDKDK